ncbi:hypothetical protein FA13DRAFT_1791839 [Coprinellus micaceus]|uniref:DUF6533 domain-containing protein n=1 Tax=Coprinellus micaceus TaxID=71717 RepID=A0A4Y7TB19_COPMI|nr:hypothetical protein FA13DRAFT_1791839 [Coprinellus micaceus]
MSDSTQALIALLVEAQRAVKIVGYVTMSSHALVIADFVHTFPDEVRLMWPTPLSLPKVLFFIPRYYIFANNVFWALSMYRTDLTPEECTIDFRRLTLSSQMVVLISEAILFFRVYAFSGENKKLLVWLVLQFLGLYIGGKVYLLVKYMQSVKFVQFPFTGMYCIPAEVEHQYLSYVFALLLVNIVVIMGIMMVLAFLKHRNLKSNLLRVFYRDGIYYFVLLSSFAIANIIINAAFSNGGLEYLFINMEVNLHVILSTRMILHLRLWAERDSNNGALGSGAAGRFTPGSRPKFLSAIRFKSRTIDSSLSQGSRGNDIPLN